MRTVGDPRTCSLKEPLMAHDWAGGYSRSDSAVHSGKAFPFADRAMRSASFLKIVRCSVVGQALGVVA